MLCGEANRIDLPKLQVLRMEKNGMCTNSVVIDSSTFVALADE